MPYCTPFMHTHTHTHIYIHTHNLCLQKWSADVCEKACLSRVSLELSFLIIIGLSEVETYLDFVKVCTFSTPRQALPLFHTLVIQGPSKIPKLLPDFQNRCTNPKES